jgi:hypothetical protein
VVANIPFTRTHQLIMSFRKVIIPSYSKETLLPLDELNINKFISAYRDKRDEIFAEPQINVIQIN